MAVDEVALRWPPPADGRQTQRTAATLEPIRRLRRSLNLCKAATSADSDATIHAPWVFGSWPTCVLL
jgi:hypothetical protein